MKTKLKKTTRREFVGTSLLLLAGCVTPKSIIKTLRKQEREEVQSTKMRCS
mgnify:CR=1 FL=1